MVTCSFHDIHADGTGKTLDSDTLHSGSTNASHLDTGRHSLSLLIVKPVGIFHNSLHGDIEGEHLDDNSGISGREIFQVDGSHEYRVARVDPCKGDHVMRALELQCPGLSLTQLCHDLGRDPG